MLVGDRYTVKEVGNSTECLLVTLTEIGTVTALPSHQGRIQAEWQTQEENRHLEAVLP